MFRERINSNGMSSSSSADAGALATSPAFPRPRSSRHDRHLQRRREQRAGRRGSGPDQSAQTDMMDGEDGAGFGSWGRPRQQRQPRAHSRQQQTPDAALSAVIERLLSPQHEWHDFGRPQSSPAAVFHLSDEPLDAGLLDGIAEMPAPDGASLFANLSRQGSLRAALQLLEAAAAAGRADMLARLSHRHFLRAASSAGATGAALRFVQLLPPEAADRRTYNLALHACVGSADLESAKRVASLMAVRGVPLDAMHRTTLIAVATRALNLGAAFQYYSDAQQAAADAIGALDEVQQREREREREQAQEQQQGEQQEQAKQQQQQQPSGGGGGSTLAAATERLESARLDGWVYGALVAACCAGIKAASSDRKEQLVLLERAFGVLEDAAASHVHLEAAVWNALLMCAGRSSQLQRAFEVLDMMQTAGCRPDDITYCALIEACVLARETDMALRVFQRAQRQGVTRSLQVFTAAINACMLTGSEADLEAALEIYSTMERNGVEPDDLVYGNLIALAGAAGQLDTAFEIVEDMKASGLRPSQATCSALIYACIQNGNMAAARKVYDVLSARGVAPHISQFNSLMEHHARDFRLGDVVALLTQMVAAGVAPNANTYRIALLACQRADQAELAFEVYHLMRVNKVPIKDLNAQAICYTLLKCCLNRLREKWVPGGYPPRAAAAGGVSGGGAGGGGGGAGALLGTRPEARQLLAVLEPQGGRNRRHTFLDNRENINWVALAVGTYRDFVAAGLKPDLDVLDKVLACLRLPLSRSAGAAAGAGLLQQAAAARGADLGETAALLRDLAREASAAAGETQQQIEMAFDRRAVEVLAEAVGMGLLPSFTLDQPCQLDLRSLPPSVAEVYVLHLLSGVEARSSGPNKRPFVHRIKLLVPPFDANYVMWPNYVEKLYLHYDDELLERQELLRLEAADAVTRRQTARAEGGGGGEDGQEEGFGMAMFGRGALPQSMTSFEWEDSDDDFDARVAAARALLRQQQLAASGEDGAAAAPAPPTPTPPRRRRGGARKASAPPPPLPEGHMASPQTGLGVAATFRRLKAFAKVDAGQGIIRLSARELNRWAGAKARFEEDARRQAQSAAEALEGRSFGAVPPGMIPLKRGGPPPSLGWVEGAGLAARGGGGGGGAPAGVFGGLGALGPPRALSEQQRRIRLGMGGGGEGGSPYGPGMGGTASPSSNGFDGAKPQQQQQQQQQPAQQQQQHVAPPHLGVTPLPKPAAAASRGVIPPLPAGLRRIIPRVTPASEQQQQQQQQNQQHAATPQQQARPQRPATHDGQPPPSAPQQL